MNKFLKFLMNVICILCITILELVIGSLIFWLLGTVAYKTAMIDYSWTILHGFVLNLFIISIWGVFKCGR